MNKIKFSVAQNNKALSIKLNDLDLNAIEYSIGKEVKSKTLLTITMFVDEVDIKYDDNLYCLKKDGDING